MQKVVKEKKTQSSLQELEARAGTRGNAVDGDRERAGNKGEHR